MINTVPVIDSLITNVFMHTGLSLNYVTGTLNVQLTQGNILINSWVIETHKAKHF